MGTIFTLTPDILGPVTQLFDDTLNELGRTCKIVYPPKLLGNCPNCIYDPIGNKSSNKWLDGGPIAFPNGSVCPVCGGTGGEAIEQSDTIKLLIHWQPSTWGQTKIDNLRLSKGLIKASGFLTDLPKVLQAEYLIPDVNIEAYRHYRFRLSAEPISFNNVVRDRYFDSLWERIQ